ncbi:alkaline shock response membrane anchor protein AmaP [Clostridiaceae bacterium 35-E11]
MKLLDRIFLTIYSILVGTLALLLMFIPFNNDAYHWTSYFVNNLRTNWENILIPLLFLGISIKLLISGVKFNKMKHHSMIRHTAYGEIKISMEAIEGMAKKAASTVTGLKNIKATAHQVDDGLLIMVTALVLSDINIPEATTKLQQNVKEYIEEYTGVLVKEIKVQVEDIAINTKARVE